MDARTVVARMAIAAALIVVSGIVGVAAALMSIAGGDGPEFPY